MTETSFQVQDLDCSRKSTGATCDETGEMHSDCEQKEDNFSPRLELSNLWEQEPPAKMDYKDHVDLGTSLDTYTEMGDSSASLELSSLNPVNQIECMMEQEASNQELINGNLLSLHLHMEENQQIDHERAFGELRWLAQKENASVHLNVASKEKVQKISQLEARLFEMCQLVECIHREHLEAKKARKSSDRRVLEVQAELVAAESAVKEVKAENQAKQEVCEKQQLNLNTVLEKLEMQSSFLELNRVKECIELQRCCQDLMQKVVESYGMLRNLRENQEQLHLSFKRKEQSMQQEKEEIITALEASELKSEIQRVKLQELKNDLARFKGQSVSLEKRCAMAESKAGESSSLLGELQSKLDSTTVELFELKNSNVQVEAMRMRLHDCENALSHLTTQKAVVEISLRETRLREEHIEEVEQGNKGLEERLKWRNEQFQSLEEAHSKLRSQFKEKTSDWDTERNGLLSEIDSLESNLDSKEQALRELKNTLQMVHQALSHEESCRKLLELQITESNQALEQATAGYEAAQSATETLREQTILEISTLRNTIRSKDSQLRELQVKHLYMEQEYNEIKHIEKVCQALQSSNGEQQKHLLFMTEKMIGNVEGHEHMRSRMKEQEKNFEKERRDLVKALDLANDCLTAKDETVKQLDSELERVKGALEHMKGHRSSLDIQLKQCMEQLEGACEEAATARQALTSVEKSSQAEKSLLLESLNGKDKVVQDLKTRIHDMDQSITKLTMHEDKWLQMHRDYEELQRQQVERETDRKELEKIHNLLQLRESEEERAWLVDREKLLVKLQVTQEKVNKAEKHLKEFDCKYEGHQDVIMKLEARCVSHDKEIAEHCSLADQAREQLALEKMKLEKMRKESCTLNNSLSAALSLRDLTMQKLRDHILDLEADLRQKHEEAMIQNVRISCLDRNLKENVEMQCNMNEHIAAMKSQAWKDAEQLKMLEDIRRNLEHELRKLQEVHLATKTKLNGNLDLGQRDLSASAMQLRVATQKLNEESAQKELLLKDLDFKERMLSDLTEEMKTLVADKESLQQVVHVLETKKVGLVQEVESNKTTINQLCHKFEAAQSNLASCADEVKVLQTKLQNACKVGAQLSKANEQNRDLERYLQAAKAIAQDNEEKFRASEWAVQQLALDVGKAKTALTQKDRDEAFLQDELADLERQLRAKEGVLIEVECYLEDALMARVSMQGEVDKLCQRMEDLDRGAADWKRKELDMTVQLEVVSDALEGNRQALVACELEVKQGKDLREVMDGAIETLKLQLADEQRVSSAQQKDMNQLCKDLEKSRSKASSSAELVKGLQRRLQQLEQSSADRIKHFQSTSCELKSELCLSHIQLENYQNAGRLLLEESSRYRKKCEALLDLNVRKDSSLKDIEAQLLSIQESAFEQSKMLEQRDQGLQQAIEQHYYQDEKQISLQESLSRIQKQRSELQCNNEELVVKLRKLTGQLDNSSTDSALKSMEFETLNFKLEPMKVILAQEGESQTLMIKLADELQLPSQAVQEREVCLRSVQVSLDEANGELQILQRALAGKDSDMEVLLEKLSIVEQQHEETQSELSKLQEALTLAQIILTEKSELVSLHLRMVNSMKVETAEWKSKAEASSKKVNSLTLELLATTGRAMESQKKVSGMVEMLEGVHLELKEKTEKLLLHVASVGELQTKLKEGKEKSAAAADKRLVLKATTEGAKVLAIEKDMAMGNLQEALENAAGAISDYDLVAKTLQAEVAALRVKEEATSDKGKFLLQQLDVAQKKAEMNQQQISELQEFLESSGYELKEKMHQTSSYVSSLNNLKEEFLKWKSKVAVDESNVASLNIQLEDAEGKVLQRHEEDVQIKEAMRRLEHALIEERRSLQTLTMLEHDLIEEKRKVAESVSLIANLRENVEGWKNKADEIAEEGEWAKQEVVLIKEAMMMLEHVLIEERKNSRSLTMVEHDLVEERMKVVESASLIADLQANVDGWKTKAQDAANEGERVNQELIGAASTVSSLMLQMEAHEAQELHRIELNNRLQVDLNAAQDEALARNANMEGFLHQLEQCQDSEKELLEHLQMEHKRLIVELENGGGFDCTFEINACKRIHPQDLNKNAEDRPPKSVVRDGETYENLKVKDSQTSIDSCTSVRVNEVLEKELNSCRLWAEESPYEAHQLAGKLDAALSNVATKNLIIKLVNDEIMGLKYQGKRLKQETLPLQDSIQSEGNHNLSESTLVRFRDDGLQSTGLGKRIVESQEELDHYLELCDSLVRKNLRLEKQLDGLPRNNGGLQKQVQGLQLMDKASSDKECRALDRDDCSSEQVLLEYSCKRNANVQSAAQDRRMLSRKDIFKGNVFHEVDENVVPRCLERSQISRWPPVSPAAATQPKKAR